jgi:hypothetical protein
MEAYYDGILIGTLDDFNAKTRYQSLTGNSKNIRCEIGDWGNYHTDPHGLQYTSFRIYNPNADWLKAEFNGPNTLNLSTYVPEVNTLVIPPWPAEGRGNEGISVPLSSYLLTGTGQVYINPAYDQNIQTDIMSLAPGSPPPSNDYYHEVEINLPSVASLGDSYNHLLYVGIASRVIPSSYNPPYSANALNMMVDFDVFNGGWRFYAEMWDYLYLGESIDYDDWWDFPEFVLGANAQTVKLRVQVKGRMWNFWVNGVQQASHGVKDFYWTGASSLDSGTCKMSINMENYGSGPVGVGPPGIRIEAYRAGGILLFTPPPPGAFWTEYQACAEVLP